MRLRSNRFLAAIYEKEKKIKPTKFPCQFFLLPSVHIIPVILLGERRKKVTLEQVTLLCDVVFHIVLFN